MNKRFLFVFFLSIIPSILFSQHIKGDYGCKSMVDPLLSTRYFIHSPNQSRAHPADYPTVPLSLVGIGAADSSYTLPVIFHIIHDGELIGLGQNMATNVVNTQLAVLNEDFQANAATVLNEQDQLIAEISIQFSLATHTQEGCLLPEAGINRINRNTAGFLPPPYSSAYIDSIVKPLTIWNPEKYINIWVCQLSANIAGYAQFPNQSNLAGLPAWNGPAKTDGVVLDVRRVGNNPLAEGPYNLGKTATHELGHFLGLIHIWGDGGCGVDDFCEDTPEAALPYEGCPATGFSCNSQDMISNYMDFVDDACMTTFTVDQWARMVHTLIHSPRRNQLNAQTLHPSPIADFSVAIRKSCELPEVLIRNNISCFESTQASWQFPQATILNEENNSFLLQYPAPGIYEVLLKVKNEFGVDSLEKRIDLSNQKALDTLFWDDFERDLGQWNILNPDEKETWSLSLTQTNNPTLIQKAAFIPLYDYIEQGERDALISPSIDLSQHDSIKLCFSYAYRPFDSTKRDSLIIRASLDNGNSFPVKIFPSQPQDLIQFYQLPPTNLYFIPQQEDDWCGGLGNFEQAKCISLQDFQGLKSVQIKVEAYNDFGNNIFFDHIGIIGSCKNKLTTNLAPSLSPTVNISPNPASEFAYIRINNSLTGPVSIRIISPSGKLLKTLKERHFSTSHIIPIDLKSLPKGLLFVQLFINQKVTIFKLLHT